MKRPNKRVLTILIIAFSALVLGMGVFYGTYYFFISKSYSTYQDKVKTEIANINKVNDESSKFTKGSTIDTQLILDHISKSISELQTSQSKLKTLIITDKYEKDHNNLLLGLDNNIEIYKEILNIVKNPKNETLSNSISKLQKYRDDCLNYYAVISTKNLNINLPKESLELINNTISFTQKQVRSNIDEQILISQNQDFLNSLDEMLDQFNKIKKDYMPTVLKARNTIDGYDDLLSTISSIESILADIKENATGLNVPKDALPLYQAFTQVLSDYDLYIQNLKYAVKTEQLTSVAGVQNNDSLDKLYDPSKSQLKIADETYKKLIKLHNEFQNKL